MLPSCDSDDSPFDFLFDKRPSNNNFITYNQNPNSTQDDQDPPFFLNFSSPFFDEHELPLNQILSQNQPTSETPCFAIPGTIDQIVTGQSKSTEIVEPSKLGLDHKKEGSNLNPNNESNERRKNLGAVPRRTKGKKDRHSKICTAQGIRDRRMRLSLQAARKFFDLQDLLGYDKASKTIEWLFNNSKKAINELAKDHPQAAALRMSISTDAKSESLLSECEVVSGIGLNPNNEVKDIVSASAGLAPDCTLMTIQEERKKSQKSVVSKPNQRKESREKARVRARCRTRQKKMVCSTHDELSDHQGHISNPSEGFKLSNPNESYLEPRIGSSSKSLFESAHYQETMSTHLQERDFPPYYAVFRSLERDVGTIENLLGNTSSLSSASFSISDHFNCSAAAVSGYSSDLNNAFMGFLGNWDMVNNDQKMNNFQYGVSLEDNPNSICSATPDFL